MRISYSPHDNNVAFKPVEINSLQDFIKYATNHYYSTSVFKNEYRNAKNFLEAHCIGIDIDDGMTIEQAALKFKDYKHLIMPSKSHRKSKNGEIADRFRVIVFLEDVITSAKDFKATWYALKSFCPAMDKQCKDPSRFYYASTEVYSQNENGQLWPITRYKEPDNAPNELDLVLSDDTQKGELSAATKKFLVDGARAGERHGALVKAVFDMKEQGYTIDQIKFKVDSMAKSGGNWGTNRLNGKDELTIEDVFNRPAQYEKRDNPVHRDSMFNFQSISDLVQEAGEVQWLAEGLLTKGGFSMIAGPPKAGKSTLVRQLIRDVAQGNPFLGRDITQGSVLYLTFEEQPAILKKQFAAVGITDQDPIMVHTGVVFGDTMLEDLKDAITTFKPELVVLDTLFDVSQLESINNYKEVKTALAVIRKLARDSNTHILGVHHTNKGGVGNSSIMGSNAIHGAVDTLIRFQPEQSRRYLHSNGKYGDHYDDQEIVFDPKTESYSLGKKKEKDYGGGL